MSTDVVIVSSARSAVGSFSGSFANVQAQELGAHVIKGVLERAKVDAGDVDEVILGQVLSANQGQNPARQAAIHAGVPQEKTAWGLNQLCGSGLRAVALGLQQINNGDASVIVAGAVKGNIFAQKVEIRSTGRVWGDIVTTAFSTEEGAFLRGQIRMEDAVDLGLDAIPEAPADQEQTRASEAQSP